MFMERPAGCSWNGWPDAVECAEYLVGQQDGLHQWVQRRIDKFVDGVDPAGSVERRICRKIGLLYAAGKLARKAGILPWDKIEIETVALAAYNSVIFSAFGQKFDTPRAVQALVDNVLEGPDLVPMKGRPSKTEGVEIFGFYAADRQRYFVRMEAFRMGLASAFGADELMSECFSDVVATLSSEKILLPGHGKGLTQDVRLADGSKMKFLAIDAARLHKWLAVQKSEPVFDEDGLAS